jgi:PAS domain S-box-containing protein
MKDLLALIRLIGAPKHRQPGLKPGAIPEAWLFEAATRAVVIVEATGGTILEANRAATQLLEIPRSELIGRPFLESFAAPGREALQAALETTLADGSTQSLEGVGRTGRERIHLSVALVRSGGEAYLLVNLGAAGNGGQQPPDAQAWSGVLDMLQESPDGFLVTDQRLRITYANRAFAEMAGAWSATALRGEPLSKWVELSVLDLVNLDNQLALRQAVQEFHSTLQHAQGAQREIEICAVAVPGDDNACWGFRIRDAAAATRKRRSDA